MGGVPRAKGGCGRCESLQGGKMPVGWACSQEVRVGGRTGRVASRRQRVACRPKKHDLAAVIGQGGLGNSPTTGEPGLRRGPREGHETPCTEPRGAEARIGCWNVSSAGAAQGTVFQKTSWSREAGMDSDSFAGSLLRGRYGPPTGPSTAWYFRARPLIRGRQVLLPEGPRA